MLNGAHEAPPQPAGEGGSYDSFERNTNLPDGAVRVLSGWAGDVEWRLYAYRDDGTTCVHFSDQGPRGGGAGRRCLDPSFSPGASRSSTTGRFGYGLVDREIARVRYEHAGGGSETLDTVAHPKFAEVFYGGRIADTPLTRIVALDKNGKVVAERTDMTYYNM